MQAFNPYLPLNEFVPDGEPHVFGDRVYVFGSHDKEDGDAFCLLDYCVYSASLDDLGTWTTPGVSYSGSQDPAASENFRYLYAPDVVQGNDGRYYMYYSLSDREAKEGYRGPVSVASCDTPDGKYEYLGQVHYPDGREKLPFTPFDPAVINDDGQIRLYYGACLPVDELQVNFGVSPDMLLTMSMPWREEEIKNDPWNTMGACTCELEDDMLTVKGEVHRIIPMKVTGTSFEGHCFFEASSIRKIGDTYYFVYSSTKMHELLFATSRYPDRDFVYRGVIVSNADVGIDGSTQEDPYSIPENNHGGMVSLNGQWYIFYHRPTNKTSFSRQGCAEPIVIGEDGSITQAERTSCGLNGGPLSGKGTYPAAICCHLTNHNIMAPRPGLPKPEDSPYLRCGEGKMYVKRIDGNTFVGYKYFDFSEYNGSPVKISLKVRGGEGTFIVTDRVGGEMLGEVRVTAGDDWHECTGEAGLSGSKSGLYFYYHGEGTVDLLEFELYQEVKD